MPRGYSRDLRERLLQAEASGQELVEIGRTTGVSMKILKRWKDKQATGQSLEPGVSPGCPRKIAPDEEEALAARVAAHPDATLAEQCAQWAADGHAVVSLATMSRALSWQGLTRKKRP